MPTKLSIRIQMISLKQAKKWVILSASSLRKMVEEFLRMNGIVENLMQRLDGDPISVWDFFRFSAMRMAHIAEKFYSVLNTVYSKLFNSKDFQQHPNQ